MGIKAKNHRKKVAKRNEAIKIKEKQIKKIQQDFLMQLIEREKATGKFDGDNKIPIPGLDGPILDLGNGPLI
jgi:hypothetical protein